MVHVHSTDTLVHPGKLGTSFSSTLCLFMKKETSFKQEPFCFFLDSSLLLIFFKQEILVFFWDLIRFPFNKNV